MDNQGSKNIVNQEYAYVKIWTMPDSSECTGAVINTTIGINM